MGSLFASVWSFSFYLKLACFAISFPIKILQSALSRVLFRFTRKRRLFVLLAGAFVYLTLCLVSPTAIVCTLSTSRRKKCVLFHLICSTVYFFYFRLLLMLDASLHTFATLHNLSIHVETEDVDERYSGRAAANASKLK